MDVEPAPASAPDDALPALRPGLLAPPDLARLEPAGRATHPPRILLLYGKPAIADGGDAIAGQTALRGARRPVEFCAEPGQEGLPVGW